MSKHFQLLDFLRRAPKGLLQAYCTRRGVLAGFDWGDRRRAPEDGVARALQACGEDLFAQITADFRAVWDLADRGFTRGVLNEAKHHNDDAAYETLSGLPSHLAKAFWATLERPNLIPNAKILRDIDRLPPGAWIKRGQLPCRPGPVDDSVVEALQDALIEFFTRTQYRGQNCKVDCLRRGAEEIFYAYPEDHPDTDLFWQAGQLTPQILTPVFHVIFKHNDSRRTLEIYIEDDRTIVPKLQQVFAHVVLGKRIAEEVRGGREVYELSRLLEPGFEFRHSDDLGIADVRVTKMRIIVEGEPWRRFTAEADNLKDREALNEFVAMLIAKLPRNRLFLDQVYMTVRFRHSEGGRRPASRSFYLTYPDSIRLKKDDLGDSIAEMLVQSGLERSDEVDGQ